jgi:uncharacterized repeat protein (TIGR03803 family)
MHRATFMVPPYWVVRLEPEWCSSFEVNPAGKETVLYTFTGGTDGGNAFGVTLISALSSNLYGTASSGGIFGNGVVFKLTLP